MTDDQPTLPGMPDDPQPAASEPEPSPPSTGFSTTEKLIGINAAYRAPLTSGLAASAMLQHETDPTRRRQLEHLRTMSFLKLGASAVVGVIALIAFFVVLGSMGDDDEFGGGGGRPVPVSGSCHGEPDKTDFENVVYESDDGIHWTATYPCTGGGATTLAVPKNEVP